MARMLVEFYSDALVCNTTAWVQLPAECDYFLSGGIRRNEEGKIPVLWLLHGMGDDFMGWPRYTNLEREALSRGFAVVCPGVHSQSFYSNMPKGLHYYDFVADDLIAKMREMFPQFSDKREDNYIAGVSMGGYGALKIGLRNPDKFGKIGCLSSGNFVYFEKYLPPEQDAPPFMAPFYGVARNAFGTETMLAAAGSENDLYAVVDQAVASGKELPEIFMYCGTEDFVKGISDETEEYIANALPDKAKLTYKTSPGAHNWPFWNTHLPEMLDDLGLTKLLTVNL